MSSKNREWRPNPEAKGSHRPSQLQKPGRFTRVEPVQVPKGPIGMVSEAANHILSEQMPNSQIKTLAQEVGQKLYDTDQGYRDAFRDAIQEETRRNAQLAELVAAQNRAQRDAQLAELVHRDREHRDKPLAPHRGVDPSFHIGSQREVPVPLPYGNGPWATWMKGAICNYYADKTKILPEEIKRACQEHYKGLGPEQQQAYVQEMQLTHASMEVRPPGPESSLQQPSDISQQSPQPPRKTSQERVMRRITEGLMQQPSRETSPVRGRSTITEGQRPSRETSQERVMRRITKGLMQQPSREAGQELGPESSRQQSTRSSSRERGRSRVTEWLPKSQQPEDPMQQPSSETIQVRRGMHPYLSLSLMGEPDVEEEKSEKQ